MSLLLTSDRASTANPVQIDDGAKHRGTNSPSSSPSIPTGVFPEGEHNPHMEQNVDQMHERIRRRLEELGVTAYAVSIAAGKDKSYLRKMLGRPGMRPGADTLAALARALKMPVADLLVDEASEHVPASPEPVRVPDRLEAVPVRGTVAGSHESGAFQFDGSDVDYVERFPALANRPKVYGLYVEGDSMSPEHKHGAIRFVDPTIQPKVGDTVVVTVLDPDRGLYAILGHLVRRAEMVTIGKLNPPRDIEIPRSLIHSIHKVLTDNELAGRP
ncbi:XRE family transcriptional regulator [Neoaquamicrobium sediminum]|uniref:XRE family transcriptional regulator n=1 Tax=Neoaquamicrobium sediminum TaxID=1849104 RepID=UPI003BABBFE1